MDELITSKQESFDEDFGSLVDTSIYARIQLNGFNSEVVKSGKFTGGHYALIVNKEMQDLGESFEAIPIAWRPKAMSVAGEDLTILYDPKTDEFKEIVEMSEEPNSGCMYGPEFLMYLPEQDIVVTYFLSNKSARYIAATLRGYMKAKQAVTFTVKYIKGKRYSWHAPQIEVCSSAVMGPRDVDALQSDIEKFLNPDIVEESIAEDVEASDRQR